MNARSTDAAVFAAARRLRRTWRELMAARPGETPPSLALAITEVIAAIELHDEAESLRALREGACITVKAVEAFTTPRSC